MVTMTGGLYTVVAALPLAVASPAHAHAHLTRDTAAKALVALAPFINETPALA